MLTWFRFAIFVLVFISLCLSNTSCLSNKFFHLDNDRINISNIALFTAAVVIVIIIPFVAILYNFIIFTIYLFDAVKVIASFISYISLLNWRPTLKSIIDSLLLSIKALLHSFLKPSFNVDELFDSSNILTMFSCKSLLFCLKHGPCGL